MFPLRLAQMKALKGVIVTDCSFRLNHQSKYYLSFSHYSPCCYFILSSVWQMGVLPGGLRESELSSMHIQGLCRCPPRFERTMWFAAVAFLFILKHPLVCVASIILLVDLVSFSVFLVCSTACNSIKLFFWSFCFPEFTGIYGSV